LEEEQLIYQERVVPVEEYAFHHVLTQEAVYASIPPPRRARLHGLVGKALERLSSWDLEAHYEELAYHYERSGADEKAIEYLLKAGEKARRAYLKEEAIGYFQRALERLDGSVPGDCRKGWRLAALKGLGQIYHGMGKELEAEECFRRAIVVGQEIGLDPPELVRLYSWLADVLWWQNQNSEMVRVGEEGLALIGQNTESIEAALMNDAVGWGCFFTGNLERGREFIDRNTRFLRRLPYSEELRPVYNHVVDECTVNKNAEEALKWLQTLEQKAKAHYDLRALGEVHVFTARLLASQGDLLGALLRYQQTLELSTRIGDVKLENWGLGGIGGHYLSLGELRDAREYANRRREITESIGERQFIRTSYVQLGMISLCEGAWDQAADAFLKAAQLDREIGAGPWEVEETLALGRSYLAKGEREEALKRFQQSLSLGGPSPQILCALEEAYLEPEEFRAICGCLREEHPEMRDLPFAQWYLEPTEPLCFSQLLVSERFVMSLSSDWAWQDPFGDCAWKAENGLEIHAANGRDLQHLNLSAPRLLRSVSEGLALETTCVAVSAEKPAIGGLLLWKDSRNYLRLDRGTRGPHEISFSGCVADRDLIIGRGRLPTERVILRLERVGSRVNALCSADGQNWFTVGQVTFAVDDPLEIGVFGIGRIDRTIYHGAHPCGTAIRFESFRLMR
jgi:tetratricopeptide (TPR) repeat protein